MSNNSEPPAKMIKLAKTVVVPLMHFHEHQKVAIVIPVMAKRFLYNIHVYISWIAQGFVLKFAVCEDEEKEVLGILEEYNLHSKKDELLHCYPTSGSVNAGIAKSAAYQLIQEYLKQPAFMFTLLLDDTVNDITDTKSGVSIMTNPLEFCRVAKKLTEISPIFGGTVANGRHPKKCKQGGVVQGGFLQQAIIFSCIGAPSLSKHFNDVEDYLANMRRLTYRKVPFGEDVAFQIALYEKNVLPSGRSAQFWDIGIHRIKHESATKKPFNDMQHSTKEALREMIVYLDSQGILKTDPNSNKLTGIRVIPGGNVRIYIMGSKGERPWREAYNYAFPNPE